MIGKRFGKWTAIELSGRTSNGEQSYKCRCDCGFEKDQRADTLVSFASTQCKSCYMKERNKTDDLVGKSFGKWFVSSMVKNTERDEWFYRCLCSCGTERDIPGYQLKSGKTTQCHRCRNKTHGMSRTDTFRIWTGILRRCNNPNFKAYKYYGGRGITVSDRWLKFENFLADMVIRPSNLQIDRINNDGNYEPNNCRWVTSMENNHNRKSY